MAQLRSDNGANPEYGEIDMFSVSFPRIPAIACALVLTVMGVFPATAQDGHSGAFAPPADIIDMEPMEIITDPATYRERVARTTQLLRQADAALRDHVMASMQSVMQGHAQGFASFETWYLRRDARLRAEAAQQEVLASILSQGMTQGLNIAIPGSGLFVSALRGGLSRAYSTAVDRMAAFEGGNPQIFLAQQREALEVVRSEFLGQATTIPTADTEAWETLKWEYVFDIEDDPTGTDTAPSARIVQIARTFGIPRPGNDTIRRVALVLLEEHIAGILRADSAFMRGAVFSANRRIYVERAARLNAYRHFYAGQPNIYCPVELELYGVGLLGAGSECLEWRDRNKNH
jgi:hypothetical protein